MDRALLKRQLQARMRGKDNTAAPNIVSLALGCAQAAALLALQQACAGVSMAEIAQQYARNMDDAVLQQACAGIVPKASAACSEDTDALLVLQQACAKTAPPATRDVRDAALEDPAALPAVNVSDCGADDANNATAVECADSVTVQTNEWARGRRSDIKLVHASNAATARQHKARWGDAARGIEHNMWLLLQHRSGDAVQMRFQLQHTIAKRHAFKAQKRAVLATLQYAFLAGIVDGAFAPRPTEGFVGWLSFRVLQPQPFAALIDQVFAGINRSSVDMVLRRCGFRMPPKRGFKHLHSGEEAVEFDPEQALRYATTARPVTEFF